MHEESDIETGNRSIIFCPRCHINVSTLHSFLPLNCLYGIEFAYVNGFLGENKQHCYFQCLTAASVSWGYGFNAISTDYAMVSLPFGYMDGRVAQWLQYSTDCTMAWMLCGIEAIMQSLHMSIGKSIAY